MKIDYPSEANTDMLKLAFLYRLQELLRLDHNSTGDDYRNGVISQPQWRDFLKVWHEKHWVVIKDKIHYENTLKNNSSWTIILDNVFSEDGEGNPIDIVIPPIATDTNLKNAFLKRVGKLTSQVFLDARISYQNEDITLEELLDILELRESRFEIIHNYILTFLDELKNDDSWGINLDIIFIED